jgi:hypothetical protein
MGTLAAIGSAFRNNYDRPVVSPEVLNCQRLYLLSLQIRENGGDKGAEKARTTRLAVLSGKEEYPEWVKSGTPPPDPDILRLMAGPQIVSTPIGEPRRDDTADGGIPAFERSRKDAGAIGDGFKVVESQKGENIHHAVDTSSWPEAAKKGYEARGEALVRDPGAIATECPYTDQKRKSQFAWGWGMRELEIWRSK